MVESPASATDGSISCPKCGHAREARIRTGPLGFQRHKCSHCGRASSFPLSRGWRGFWWVVAILTAFGSVFLNITLARGYSWIPGGVGVLAFVALFIDIGLRERVGVTPPVEPSASIGGSDEHDFGVVKTPRNHPNRARPGYVATLTSLAVCAAIASVLGATVVAGLNNGYDVEVVLEEARPASQALTFDGSFDLEPGDAICGDRDDYYACVEAHRGMYNALCTDGGGWRAFAASDRLSSSALATCEQLLEFVKSVQQQLDGCGYGCTTQADANGNWGWRYLHPVPHRSMQEQAAATPAITYTDRCWFALGPIQLGRCAQESAEAAE
jgi:hypothetical protein